MQIFCDFDGTISIKDTTDEILSRFALPQWEAIELEWKQGKIGSDECMRGQIALIMASKEELDAELDKQQIDKTFFDFVNFCESLNSPITIISDGVDYFIKRILQRHNLSHLPVIANELSVNPNGSYSLCCPHINQNCRSSAGVCKCSKLAASSGIRIFIGDGRSDFCAAPEADIVFAKSTLATFCEQKEIEYVPYKNFNDVRTTIKRVLPAIILREYSSTTQAA